MWLAEDDRPFPEILVQCNENSALLMCSSQDFVIARITLPLSAPSYAVTGFPQPPQRTAPHATIEQQSHLSGYATCGSTRS